MDNFVREAIEGGRSDVQKVGNGVYAIPFDVVNPYLLSSCAHCGTSMTRMLTCSQCGEIRYCGKKCQVASWKSIHRLYCKRHREASVGNLCWDNLFAASTFSQLTVTLREHEGLGQLIESAIGQVLMSKHHLVQNAKPTDIKSMARAASRRLSRGHPDADHAASSGLLTIAAAMATIAPPWVDNALAETPLFKCVARYYLHYAPQLASGGGQEIADIPLLSAMVNLVHPNAPAPPELMTRCVDATWDAIEASLATLAEETDKQKEKEQSKNNRTGAEAKEEEKEEDQATSTRKARKRNNKKKKEATPSTTPPGVNDQNQYVTTTNNDDDDNNKTLQSASIGTSTEAKKEERQATNRRKARKRNMRNKKKKKEAFPSITPPNTTGIPDQNQYPNNNNNNDDNKTLQHLRNGIIPNLRMLARNLAFVDAHPSPRIASVMPRIVVADFVYGIEDFDHNAIQVWATTAQNMVEMKTQQHEDEQQETKCPPPPPSQDQDNNHQMPPPPEHILDNFHPETMADIGNAIFSVIQVCAKQKLGGVDIVFRNEPPPGGFTDNSPFSD